MSTVSHTHTLMQMNTLSHNSSDPIMSAVMYVITHARAYGCMRTHTDESWEQSSDNVNCHTGTHMTHAHAHTHTHWGRTKEERLVNNAPQCSVAET